ERRGVRRSLTRELDLPRERGDAIAEAAVDRVRRGPEARDGLAARVAGVELRPHHRLYDSASPVGGKAADDAHARRRDATPGHGQLEGKGAGAADCAATLPGRVHSLGGQDARDTLELVIGRRRTAEIVPDRSHRRAQLVRRGARSHLPAHVTLSEARAAVTRRALRTGSAPRSLRGAAPSAWPTAAPACRKAGRGGADHGQPTRRGGRGRTAA